MDAITSHLFEQIEAARPEIIALENNLGIPVQNTTLFQDLQWKTLLDRCKSTAVNLSKILLNYAQLLDGFFFNQLLRQLPSLDPALAAETAKYVENNLTSVEVSNYLCKALAGISPAFNDHSTSNDYPDLIRNDFDYGFLVKGGSPGDPGIRGGRPINVPDGVEIKTSKNSSINLDCHGPKAGCFVYFMWGFSNKVYLKDVYVAFLKKSDFKKGNSNSKQTTPKWNIKDSSSFISIKTNTLYKTSREVNPTSGETSLFEYTQPDFEMLSL